MDLAGIKAKIERAREGIQSLEADISAYCEFQRRQMIFDWSQRKEHLLESHPPVPISYSIRIGEIAYNLRSCFRPPNLATGSSKREAAYPQQ